MSITLRPRFPLVGLGVAVGATALAALAGAGLISLVGVPFALLYAWVCRQALRIDGGGVRYRGFLPGEDFHSSWSEIVEVSVDIVNTSIPGSPGSLVARARFGRREGAPLSAQLFSASDAEPLIAACRERGVSVLDLRGGR